MPKIKLTKKMKSEVMGVYNSYWDSYFKGDMKTFASLLHEHVQIIGSSENEVFSGKKSAVKFYKATVKQVAGKTDLRNRTIRLLPVNENILITEQSDFYVKVDGRWTYYGRGRISTMMQQTAQGWKIISEHGSLPDSRAGEGEQINTEKIKSENRQLREAVKRRTFELEEKNRELEIETALERVRAVAMGMKERSDMLEICRTIAQQLDLLDVKNIRNVQTAIFHSFTRTYTDYEYYTKHDKLLITEVDYSDHPVQKKFAQEMQKGAKKIFQHSFRGKQVKKWLQYQKATNVFIDSYLEHAPSLNYYWYSLGPVAMGISTYAPLNEDEVKLFRRFRNVFDLAYRRYLDIERAETQSREARIEAALEKVRAVAMGMRAPSDLLDICEILFKEFQSLGFSELRNAMINIHDDEKKSFMNYDYSDAIGGSTNHLTYVIHPLVEKQIKKIRSANDAFSETYFTGKDLKEWKKFRRRIGEKNDPRLNNASGLYYYFYSIGVGSIGISTFGPVGEEKTALLKRFRNVFALSYQRYTDIARSAAQAREAQIQLALERVRARTMAMQHSDELKNAAALLFRQVKALGAPAYSCGYNIWENHEEVFTSWMSTQDGSEINAVRNIPLTEDMNFIRFAESRQKGEQFFVLELRGKRMQEHYRYLKTIPAFKVYFDYAVKAGFALPETQIHHLANFSHGNLLFITLEPCPEFHDVFKRFASVFDQTYTRFLDLQKAEAQAREAQIEAALEKVRGGAMAMHTSNDLAVTVSAVFSELRKLGLETLRAGVALYSKGQPVPVFYASSASGKDDALTITNASACNMKRGRRNKTTFRYSVEKSWKRITMCFRYSPPFSETAATNFDIMSMAVIFLSRKGIFIRGWNIRFLRMKEIS
jgi:hypothetical protein